MLVLDIKKTTQKLNLFGGIACNSGVVQDWPWAIFLLLLKMSEKPLN